MKPVHQPIGEAGALRRDLAASRGVALADRDRAMLEGHAWGRPRRGDATFAADEAEAQQVASGRGEVLAGADFAQVRLHTDAAAQSATTRLRAHAFTIGEAVFLGAGVGAARDSVLQHEAAHVLQQRDGAAVRPRPRLIATGSEQDIERFFAIAEPAIGAELEHDPVSGQITSTVSRPEAPASPAFAAELQRILDDPADDAELSIGGGQPNVMIGAFPLPGDMTGNTVQTIGIDDIEAIEADAPGTGMGALMHEIAENYEAHRNVRTMGGAVPGVDQFEVAHEAAVERQSSVAQETVADGRRVAAVKTPPVAGAYQLIVDYEQYFVVVDVQTVGNDFQVRGARQAERQNLQTVTVDSFASNSAALPAGAAAALAGVAPAALGAPTSTVRIEGFTDNQGTEAANRKLSDERAEAVRAVIHGAGIGDGRMSAVGLGSSRFVAANDTDANRARNRRVVVEVDRPL